MASTSLPLLLVLALLALGFAAGQLCRNNVTSFVLESFDCFRDRHLKCTGDCVSTADGKLNLTSYDMRSWGRLMYWPGIRLMDPITTRVAYFSTNFTFSMRGDNSRPGEGLAFVMQANPDYQGHSGGFLGLYNKDGKAGTPTVAIEFDTYRDWFYGFFMYNDINNNHVGVDIESINSKVQVDAGSVGIDLGKERSVTAWIDYIPASDNFDGNLQVRISTDAIRPLLPLLNYNVDLSKHISEIMHLGFSATTGDHLVTSDCVSYHNILRWSFDSWGLGPNSPPPVPPSTPPPILPPHPSVPPPIPLPPEPPTPSPLLPPSPALPPLTPDAPNPLPSDFSPPAPAPVPSPSPSPGPSETPPPYPIFPPSPFLSPTFPPDSPVPVPSPDTPIPDSPAPSPTLSPQPAISPSSPHPADGPSLPPESIPSPSAGPAPSSYASPPAPLPPAPVPTPSAGPAPSIYISPPASLPPARVPTPSAVPAPSSYVSPPAPLPPAPVPTPFPGPAPSSYVSPPAPLPISPAPTPSAGPAPSSYVSPPAPLPPAIVPPPSTAPSPSTGSPNSTVSPSSEPSSPTPAPTSLPAPTPSPASTPVPTPPPGRLDATRPMAASIAGFTLVLSCYALVVYNRVLSELGDGIHSHHRLGYLGDQTMIGIWPGAR